MVAQRDEGRRRDAAATRAALLKAARELFIERGFDRTTVRDIAARAGVNQALLFRYFGGKDAVFRTAMTSVSEQLIAETPPEQLVARILGRLLDPEAPKARDNPIYAFMRSGSHDETASMFAEDVGVAYRRALAVLTDAEDAEIRAELVLAWLLGIALVRSVLDQRPLADADSEPVAAHVLRAVATLLERVDQRPADPEPRG